MNRLLNTKTLKNGCCKELGEGPYLLMHNDCDSGDEIIAQSIIFGSNGDDGPKPREEKCPICGASVKVFFAMPSWIYYETDKPENINGLSWDEFLELADEEEAMAMASGQICLGQFVALKNMYEI